MHFARWYVLIGFTYYLFALARICYFAKSMSPFFDGRSGEYFGQILATLLIMTAFLIGWPIIMGAQVILAIEGFLRNPRARRGAMFLDPAWHIDENESR